MHQHSVSHARRAHGRGYRTVAAVLVAMTLAGCVHKAPGVPTGRPAPVINTDRPGTLSH